MGTEEERLKVESIVDNAAHLFDLGGDMSEEPPALLLSMPEGTWQNVIFLWLFVFFSEHFFTLHQCSACSVGM